MKLGWLPGGSPQWLFPGNVAVIIASTCSLPQAPPFLKAYLLYLSLNVYEGWEGMAAPVGELCYTICTLINGLVSRNLCMSWYPPDVDLDVISTLEDMVKAPDNLGGEVLSCC